VRYFLSIIIFNILFIVSSYGQNQDQTTFSLAGTLVNDQDKVISEANINISGFDYEKDVIADRQGKFKVNNLKAGVYIVTVNLNDFIDYFQVNIVNQDVVRDFKVDRSKNNLDEVFLKVQSVKSEIEKKGFAVNVIETKESATRNLQTNELLDQSVGVRVRRNGGLGAAVDYNLNGLSGNSIRIFIDGIPISTYGSSFDLNSLSPAMIERIEVYKGVVPGKLSGDALGGAINIVLNKDIQNHINASISYGSFNTTQANINAFYKADSTNLYLRASAFYNYSDNDYEIWGRFVKDIAPNGRITNIRAKRFEDAFKSYGGNVEAGYTDLSWADNISLGYTHSDLYNEIQHGLYMTIPYKGRYQEAQANAFNLNYNKKDILKGLGANINAVYSKRETFISDTVSYVYNWYGEKSLDLDGDPIRTSTGAQQGAPTLLTLDRDILSLRGGIDYSFNKQHKLLLNHLFNSVDRSEDDAVKTNLQRQFQETRKVQQNISSLTYENHLFDDHLKTTIFGKYYHIKTNRTDFDVVRQNQQNIIVKDEESRSIDNIGYGGAISYLIKPAVTLLGSAERAIRFPTESEFFGAPGENMLANPGLSPEISDNYNLGFKVGPYQYKSHQLSVSANGFIRDTKDKIARQASRNSNDAQEAAPFVNLNKTFSQGFDAELNYSYRRNLKFSLNVSKFNSYFNDKYDSNGNVLELYRKQLPNNPFFTANANLQYSLRNVLQKESKLNLFYNLNFVDSFYNIWLIGPMNGIDDRDQIPEQYLHDFGLSYTFPNKNLIASFDVKNILNDEIYDNFGVQRPGRAFYIKLNYTLKNF